MKDYGQRITNSLWRQNPERDTIMETRALSETLSDSYDIQKYIKVAMNEVDEKYTARTIETGERVKSHLQKGLQNIDYRYQGSVMTRTHIKGYSDIDLLTICNKFYTWDSYNANRILESYTERQKYYQSQIEKLEYEKNLSLYTGNSYEDLRGIRLNSENILQRTYDKCDISHPKAIKIRNQDLHRDVDIVTASWYDDVRSITQGKGDYRGIQIYNKDNGYCESSDYPFLSIKRINDRGGATHGRIKKMIRFLKTLKADSSTEIRLSSFDINAICYNIETTKYQNATYLELVIVLYLEFDKINNDINYANQIVSVDGKEYIFNGNPDKYSEFKKLYIELIEIVKDLHTYKLIG